MTAERDNSISRYEGVQGMADAITTIRGASRLRRIDGLYVYRALAPAEWGIMDPPKDAKIREQTTSRCLARVALNSVKELLAETSEAVDWSVNVRSVYAAKDSRVSVASPEETPPFAVGVVCLDGMGLVRPGEGLGQGLWIVGGSGVVAPGNMGVELSTSATYDFTGLYVEFQGAVG